MMMLPARESIDRNHPSPPPPQQIELKSTNLSALVTRALELLHNRNREEEDEEEAAASDDVSRNQETQSPQHPVYIAIAGAPGSGKSTLAQRLVHWINHSATTKSNRDPVAVLIPMDGYHYSQAQLRAMSNNRRRCDDGGPPSPASIIRMEGDSETTPPVTFDDWMKRRGAPWTFDAPALYQNLARTKQRGHGTFPLYDRNRSDPVPDQIHVHEHHKIIVCEGNYLLAYDDPAWQPLQQIWDDTWLVQVPAEILQERLVRRHLQHWTPVKEARFGVGRAGAVAKVESSDWKNAQYVQATSPRHANVIIHNN